MGGAPLTASSLVCLTPDVCFPLPSEAFATSVLTAGSLTLVSFVHFVLGETPAGMFLWFRQLSSSNIPLDSRASLRAVISYALLMAETRALAATVHTQRAAHVEA